MHHSTASLSGLRKAQEDPDHWLGSTALLDLEDSKLRLRARALTQLCKTDREKALAIYGYVKRIPFAKPFKFRVRGPREVLDSARGDALDKVGLLLALLRIAGIPSRIRYIEQRGEMLRGLISHMTAAARPVAEMWVGARWIATDTYIFDAAYMAAARKRLEEQGWECGYGIHRDGHAIWNGMEDAYLAGPSHKQMNTEFGVYQDPVEFVAGPEFSATHPPVARTLHWNAMVPSMGKVIRELRKEAVSGAPAPRRSST